MANGMKFGNSGAVLTIEAITPAIAQDWINRNTGNRSLRDGVVEKYAADMYNGHWTECIVPIVFYADDGSIADGQHRLWAIMESGTTQTFIVLRDYPRAAGLNIDTGLLRSIVDNARISGVDTDLSNTLVAVATAIEAGVRSARGPGRRASLTSTERLELVERHREAARWAMKYGPNARGLRNTITLAALGRAWYHEADKERLARFGKVLTDGMSEAPNETAAVAIRNYLVTKGKAAASAPEAWRDTFLKVQNAINYFMRGKRLSIIKGVATEAYPLKTKPMQLATISNKGKARLQASRDLAKEKKRQIAAGLAQKYKRRSKVAEQQRAAA